MCQVLFGVAEITNQMAPAKAVRKIQHLLVTTSETGVSDHKTLLAAYKEFDQYLTEKNIVRPVILLSDGHSSRFDYEVLSFLQSKNIRLFLTPPDTTGVTQLLDQVNKNLHHEYRETKDNLFTSVQTVNKEAFMIILGHIWSKWASEESIVKAAKRVGITVTGLDVGHMQQDKFDRAAEVLEADPPLATSTPNTALAIESPAKRKNSAAYWKGKFDASQRLVRELSEKSLQLEEIPGLLSVQKIKPKLSKKTTRVTQVHGSMTGKNVLQIVQSIKDKKDRELHERDAKVKQKDQEKEDFFRCKKECVCGNVICAAIKLKECPSCHNIMRSTCSKSGCKVEGCKPTMIMPAAVLFKTKKTFSQKRNLPLHADDLESDLSFNEEEFEGEFVDDSDVDMASDTDDENEDPLESAKKQLVASWKGLSPSVREEEIQGKWFAVAYSGKRRQTLIIGKVLRRFLVEKDGAVECLEMKFLKPKVGSGNVLEDTPKHLPDIENIPLKDVIAGPLEVTPHGTSHFIVLNYQALSRNFAVVSKVDRVNLKI